MVIITLSNGKRVGNFSSPHAFYFEDGSTLPAVSEAEAMRLGVTFKETPMKNGISGDLKLSFSLSMDVMEEFGHWIKLHKEGKIDMVIVPLPMMTALKKLYVVKNLIRLPFRTVRMVSRIDKRVSITKQCI